MPIAVSAAFDHLPQLDFQKLPWEEGVFACIFDNKGPAHDSLFVQPDRPVQPAVLEARVAVGQPKASSLDQGVELFRVSVKSSLDISWKL